MRFVPHLFWKTLPRASALSFLLLLGCPPLTAQDSADFVISYITTSPQNDYSDPVIRTAYARIGITVRFEGVQSAESIARVNAGLADAELQRVANITDQFPNLVRVPVPISASETIGVSKNPDIKLDGWESLSPYRIGMTKGSLAQEGGIPGLSVTTADTPDELLDLLLRDEIDIAVGGRAGLITQIRRRHLESTVHRLDNMLEVVLLYHYVHKRHTDLVPQLRKALGDMLRSGELQRLRQEQRQRLEGQREDDRP